MSNERKYIWKIFDKILGELKMTPVDSEMVEDAGCSPFPYLYKKTLNKESDRLKGLDVL